MNSVANISHAQAYKRQIGFALTVLTVFGVGFALMVGILATGGFTLLEKVILVLFGLLFIQVAFGATVAAAGFWVLSRGGDPLRITSTPANEQAGALPSTAV